MTLMTYEHRLHRGFQFGVPSTRQTIELIEDGQIQRYEINYSLGSGYFNLVTPMGGDTNDDSE